MDCQNRQAYLNNDLTSAEQDAFGRHMAECTACRQAVASEQALINELLASQPARQSLEPANAARMRHQLQRKIRRSTLMRNTRLSLQQMATVTILLLVTVGIFFYWQRVIGDADTVPGATATRLDGGDNPGEPVTLTFAAPSEHEIAYQSLIKSFTDAHPNITIQYVGLTNEDIVLEDLAQRADTILLPFLPGSNVGSFADLTPLQNADTTFDTADFWPQLLDACRVGNRTIGLPVSVQTHLILYNPEAFAAAGLAEPALDWSWTEFETAVQRLASVSQYGFIDPTGFSLLTPRLRRLVQNSSDGTVAAARLADEAGWYVRLVENGAIPALTDDFFIGEQLVEENQAAMWVETMLNLDYRLNNVNPTPGVASFPGDVTLASANCAAISNGSDHPQAAWEWIHFLSQQEPIGSSERIPARPSVAAATGYWQQWPEPVAAALRYALAHPYYDQRDANLQTVQATLLAVLQGEQALPTADIALSPTAPPPTAVPVVVATPRPTADPDSDVVTINYGGLIAHGEQAQLQALADAFQQEHPGIIVKTAISPNDWTDISPAGLAGEFDCFTTPDGQLTLSSAERLLRLDPLIDREPAGFRDDFPAQITNYFRLNGQQYGLPLSITPPVIYYNATHLAELGLSPPNDNWTAEDFWALIGAAATEDVVGFTPLQQDQTIFLLGLRGVQLYDLNANPPVANFDDPATTAAFEWVDSLIDDGTLAAPGEFFLQITAIQDGEIAFWVDSVTTVAHTDYVRGFFPTDSNNNPDIDFDVGVVALPQAQSPFYTLDARGFFISKSTPHPEACWEWFKFLSAQPDAMRGMPARATTRSRWSESVGEDAARAYQTSLLRPAQSPYFYEDSYQLQLPLAEWAHAVWEGIQAGDQAADLLTAAQLKADAYLVCLGEAQLWNRETAESCALAADPEYEP